MNTSRLIVVDGTTGTLTVAVWMNLVTMSGAAGDVLLSLDHGNADGDPDPTRRGVRLLDAPL